MIIAIDFDGTCTTHEFPYVGKDIGAIPVLKKLVEKGHGLVLLTMRDKNYLDAAVKWFDDNEISLYGIQRNPTQNNWTTSPKAYAELYIDDAALGCPLVYPENGDRPYVDWNKVEQLLIDKKVL